MNKKKICLMAAMALLFASVFSQKGLADDRILVRKPTTVGYQKYVPGEIIVKFKPGVSDEMRAGINSRHGASVVSTSRFAGFKKLRIPRRKAVAEMVEIYKRNPNVAYAEPNYIAYAFWAPNDPAYTYQWHFDNAVYGGINMESAWDIETGDSSVIVAVIDSGVAYERYRIYRQAPDLANTNFVAGYDFVNNDTHPNDDEGHGTHVTGTVAQSTNNGIGVAGVAFNCSIMPVKVLDNFGSGTYADVADGIYFAADNGAQVINLSLGGPAPSITLENACAYAYNKGVTIVCASGNDGSLTDVCYPAAYDAYCIAVGATTYNEKVAYYSNAGEALDLTAPGGDVWDDLNGDDYADGVLQQTYDGNYTTFAYWFYQGTSMAAPHVSAVAALLISSGVAATPDEVREALQATAKDKWTPGWDSEYGHGIVDAYAALSYSVISNNPPVADANGPYNGTEDVAVTFDGSGSYDPDSDSLTYAWSFGDGSTGAGVNPTHIYISAGTYTVTLVVNDGKVNSDPSPTTATIDEGGEPLVVDVGPNQSALVGETVTFNGSASCAPWNFGDGTTGDGITTTHTYSVAGTYTVTLTVTDSAGLTGTDTAIVTVEEQEQPALVMHVASIDMSTETRRAGRNRFTTALAAVAVVDGSGSPVESAAAGGSWSGLAADSDSGLTNAEGIVVLKSDEARNASGTFTFTVDDITKDGWTYDSAANVETGDSTTVP